MGPSKILSNIPLLLLYLIYPVRLESILRSILETSTFSRCLWKKILSRMTSLHWQLLFQTRSQFRLISKLEDEDLPTDVPRWIFDTKATLRDPYYLVHFAYQSLRKAIRVSGSHFITQWPDIEAYEQLSQWSTDLEYGLQASDPGDKKYWSRPLFVENIRFAPKGVSWKTLHSSRYLFFQNNRPSGCFLRFQRFRGFLPALFVVCLCTRSRVFPHHLTPLHLPYTSTARLVWSL